MTEDQLEQEVLGWLAEIGYTQINGYDIAPDGPCAERADCVQPLLLRHLISGQLGLRNVDAALAKVG